MIIGFTDSEGGRSNCEHADAHCINPHEIIRKYRCPACNQVMMCACDEEFGQQFLSHQLSEGCELRTQRRVAVTLGFQRGICNTCRGIPEEAHPAAEIYGRASKICRYYWREILMEKTRRLHTWAQQDGSDLSADVVKQIEREVVADFRALHQAAPKYTFRDQSQQEVLDRNGVEVLHLNGTYIKHSGRRVALLHNGTPYNVEEFAALELERSGYRVLKTESIPFHVLFGTYFWMLIEEPFDPLVRLISIPERGPFEDGGHGQLINVFLPQDFGCTGYAERRASAVEEHFSRFLNGDRKSLQWTFDLWTEGSQRLRQYLWAHRPEQVAIARRIVEILPADALRRVLRYLIADYWARFCGWPDLLAYTDTEFMFVEVKSSGDDLSEDQKQWIEGNASELRFPFKLLKVHKKATIKLP